MYLGFYRFILVIDFILSLFIISEQFEAQQDELERRREECIQLRTVLANRSQEMRSMTQTSYGKDVDIVNEDGELAIAYQTQKQINRCVYIFIIFLKNTFAFRLLIEFVILKLLN